MKDNVEGGKKETKIKVQKKVIVNINSRSHVNVSY